MLINTLTNVNKWYLKLYHFHHLISYMKKQLSDTSCTFCQTSPFVSNLNKKQNKGKW